MRTKQVGMFPSELVENGLRRGNHSFFSFVSQQSCFNLTPA